MDGATTGALSCGAVLAVCGGRGVFGRSTALRRAVGTDRQAVPQLVFQVSTCPTTLLRLTCGEYVSIYSQTKHRQPRANILDRPIREELRCVLKYK